MLELAKDLIQGLINGIKNMAANAAGAMLQLSKSLIEKLNPGEWIERGKELGQKLGEGIGNAKETVSNKIGELADAAQNRLSKVDLTNAGAAVGNSIAKGIQSTKQNISNQMDDIINTLTNKGSSIQNKMASIQYAQSHALMGGAVGTAEMYGAAGDTLETEEEAIVNLLEKYLPIIASRGNDYNQLNREFGWAIQ
jgi:phage-related protein